VATCVFVVTFRLVGSAGRVLSPVTGVDDGNRAVRAADSRSSSLAAGASDLSPSLWGGLVSPLGVSPAGSTEPLSNMCPCFCLTPTDFGDWACVSINPLPGVHAARQFLDTSETLRTLVLRSWRREMIERGWNERPSRHRLGPRDMTLEAKGFRHVAVAIPEVLVSRGIAVSPLH
jgi:hypothetical protein